MKKAFSSKKVSFSFQDFEKRHYRKVAVVEEFFDIIYNIHMELGGRSGMHAGQKRTYRIVSREIKKTDFSTLLTKFSILK